MPTQQRRVKKIPRKHARQKNSKGCVWELGYAPVSFKSISVYNPVFPKAPF